MRIKGLSIAASLLFTLALAAPAIAKVTPYVRVDYGGSQFQMSDANETLKDSEDSFNAAGLPADFKAIGGAYGPSITAGAWVLPNLRVGATYSYGRTTLENTFDGQGVTYEHNLDFRMAEIGLEVAYRNVHHAGFTIGANVARGRGVMIEGITLNDTNGLFQADWTAIRAKPTFGAFIGLDQTNLAGVAGTLRLGYQFRNMGGMPSRGAVTGISGTIETTSIPLDYSGFYLRLGIGFDRVQ